MEASWLVTVLVILAKCSRPPANLQIDTRNVLRVAALHQVGKVSGNDALSLTIEREMVKPFIGRSIHQALIKHMDSYIGRKRKADSWQATANSLKLPAKQSQASRL